MRKSDIGIHETVELIIDLLKEYKDELEYRVNYEEAYERAKKDCIRTTGRCRDAREYMSPAYRTKDPVTDTELKRVFMLVRSLLKGLYI